MSTDCLIELACRGCGDKLAIALPDDAPIASRTCHTCGTVGHASHYERIDIGLSEVCNLACNMCRRPQEKATMPRERVLGLLTEARSIGVKTVSFSGGEPFVHPHIREILSHALGLGISVELVTNGTLIREQDVPLLAALHCVTVSVDGPREVHDHIRGSAGSWDKTMRTLALLNQGHARWGTNTVIQALNADLLFETWQAIRAAGHPAYVGFTHVEVVPETSHLQPDAQAAALARAQLALVRAECASGQVHFNDDAIVTRLYDVFADKTRRYRPVGGCRIPQTFLGVSSHGIYPCWHQGRALKEESLVVALSSEECRSIVAEARASRCIGCNAANYSWSDEWVAGIAAAAGHEWSEGVVYLAEAERRNGRLAAGKRTIPLLERQARGHA